jgi:hypothetical protein
MSLFQKKSDPLADKARELNEEIARLEREIRQLSVVPARKRPSFGVFRGTSSAHPPAVPPPSTPSRGGATPIPQPGPSKPTASGPDPAIALRKSRSAASTASSRHLNLGGEPIADDHFNAQGLRKFDLAAILQRWIHPLRGPSPTSTPMATLLAAGSVHGLRPLRYEKRVARNRFIGLFIFLLLILLGLARIYF